MSNIQVLHGRRFVSDRERFLVWKRNIINRRLKYYQEKEIFDSRIVEENKMFLNIAEKEINLLRGISL